LCAATAEAVHETDVTESTAAEVRAAHVDEDDTVDNVLRDLTTDCGW